MSLAVLVKENESYFSTSESRIQTFISTYFKEFLEEFFPAIFKSIDSTVLLPVHLSEELQQYPLVVYKTQEDGIESLVYILLDQGNGNQTEINKQMYRIFNSLYKKYQLPIIPALVTFQNNNILHEEYAVSFYHIETLTFHYSAVQIQKQEWRKYVRANNVIAAALFQHLNFSKEEKEQLHFEILNMLVRIHSEPAEQRLFYDLFTEDH